MPAVRGKAVAVFPGTRRVRACELRTPFRGGARSEGMSRSAWRSSVSLVCWGCRCPRQAFGRIPSLVSQITLASRAVRGAGGRVSLGWTKVSREALRCPWLPPTAPRSGTSTPPGHCGRVRARAGGLGTGPLGSATRPGTRSKALPPQNPSYGEVPSGDLMEFADSRRAVQEFPRSSRGVGIR